MWNAVSLYLPLTACYPPSFPLNPSVFPPIPSEIMTTPPVATINSHRSLRKGCASWASPLSGWKVGGPSLGQACRLL